MNRLRRPYGARRPESGHPRPFYRIGGHQARQTRHKACPHKERPDFHADEHPRFQHRWFHPSGFKPSATEGAYRSFSFCPHGGGIPQKKFHFAPLCTPVSYLGGASIKRIGPSLKAPPCNASFSPDTVSSAPYIGDVLGGDASFGQERHYPLKHDIHPNMLPTKLKRTSGNEAH